MRKHKRRIVKRLRIVAAFNGVRAAIRGAAESFAELIPAMIAASVGAFSAFAWQDTISTSFAADHVSARPKRLGPQSRYWWLR